MCVYSLSHRSLDSLSSLTELNLAGNRITAFSDLLSLSRLIHLKSLSLYHVNYGANPVCEIDDYHVFSRALFKVRYRCVAYSLVPQTWVWKRVCTCCVC